MSLREIALLAARGAAGGTLVIVFSAMGEVVSPKRLSGIFSAAPSVAIASLALTLAASGREDTRVAATGMVAGAVALVACCAVAVDAVRRFRALRGSLVAVACWLAAAAAAYAALPR